MVAAPDVSMPVTPLTGTGDQWNDTLSVALLSVTGNVVSPEQMV